MRYLFFAVLAVILFIYAKHFSKHKKPFVSALKTSLFGVASFMAVNSLSSFTGVFIAVNYVTVALTALLGVPGTVMLLLMRLIMKS